MSGDPVAFSNTSAVDICSCVYLITCQALHSPTFRPHALDINRKFKITLVMVTHDSYAASFCDKVILLKDGIQFLEIEKNNKSNSTFLKDIYELLKRIGGE